MSKSLKDRNGGGGVKEEPVASLPGPVYFGWDSELARVNLPCWSLS